jgi:hypothetical protein
MESVSTVFQLINIYQALIFVSRCHWSCHSFVRFVEPNEQLIDHIASSLQVGRVELEGVCEQAEV